MQRDELIQHLSSFVSQGIRVPEQAFEIARNIDLARFERTPVREAAILLLRMALQKRFGFLTVRSSLVDRLVKREGNRQRKPGYARP